MTDILSSIKVLGHLPAGTFRAGFILALTAEGLPSVFVFTVQNPTVPVDTDLYLYKSREDLQVSVIYRKQYAYCSSSR